VLVIPANADACYTDSFMMEYDVHTLLDLLTLSATLWVLYTMRTKLARSYNARKDSTRVELIVRASHTFPSCGLADVVWCAH
jgi:hypothetical protein